MKRIRRSPHAKEGACHGVEVASEEPRVPADGANRAKEGGRSAGPALPAIRFGAEASAGAEIDVGVALLVEALNRVGASTESSCEGHLRRLSTGERCRPCLPYVVFRARCEVVDLVLEVAR